VNQALPLWPIDAMLGRSGGYEDQGFGSPEPTTGAGTTTPDDEVPEAAGLGACEPDRVSSGRTVNPIAVSTQAPTARPPMVMRAFRLSTQKRLPHLRQR
jgi:hypothetical protein